MSSFQTCMASRTCLPFGATAPVRATPKPIRIGSAAGAAVTAARQSSIAAAANLDNARNRPTILIILTAYLPRSPSGGQDWKFAVESIDHRAIVGNADFAT